MIIYLVGSLIIIGVGVMFGGDEVLKYYHQRKKVILNKKIEAIREDIEIKKKLEKQKKKRRKKEINKEMLSQPIMNTQSHASYPDITGAFGSVLEASGTALRETLGRVGRESLIEKQKRMEEESLRRARVEEEKRKEKEEQRIRDEEYEKDRKEMEEQERKEQEKISKELKEEETMQPNPDIKAGDFVTVNKKGKHRRTIYDNMDIDTTYQVTSISNYDNQANLIGEGCKSGQCHTAFLRKLDGSEAKYKYVESGTCTCGRNFKTNMQDIDKVLPESDDHVAMNLITCGKCKSKWKVKIIDMNRQNYNDNRSAWGESY